MPFKDLREYIDTLDKNGEVQKIKREVNWNLEAGAIVRRSYELNKPAPFFERITGYPKGYRMFGAPLSNYKRLSIALGLEPDTSYNDLMEFYLKRKAHPIKPILVKDGPCKENIHTGDDINLFEFPAPMVHDGDGGRYLCTWHANITKNKTTGVTNWGMYRAMIHTRNTLGGLMEPFKHIGFHYYRIYEAEKKPMPFAIAIGMETVCSIMALTPISYKLAEADVAGGLRGKPVELIKCETVDLEVPATSEIILEGHVAPEERLPEGPFGEFTGYRASPRDNRPVYRVTAITHRNNPILTMSCMGTPVDDCHAPMSVTGGAELLEELRSKSLPIKGLCLYPGCVNFLVAVSVKAPYPNVAQKIASTIWSREGHVPPYIIIVDDDVEPTDMEQVLHALATKCHPWRGITRLEHATGSALSPFSSRYERLNHLGAAAYFDCTWPLDWDPSIAVPPRASFDKIYPQEIQEHVVKNWENYGYKD